MDYSNFIRNFYRQALNQLKSYKNYYGQIVQLNSGLDIPNEFLFNEPNDSLFLPQKSVNINAPAQYFVQFMDYYIQMMPDLGFVFANEQRINAIYEYVVNMNILEDDELVLKYIELNIGVGVKALESQGILEHGEEIK